MLQKQDICPHCGGNDTMIGKQNGHGAIVPQKGWTVINAKALYHVICRNCGTVIRSYIEDPQDWAKK